MPRPDASRFLASARALDGAGEARRLYDAWAPTYDEDIYATLRITGTARIAALLHHFTSDPAIHILDVGCGTGAAGAELHKLGFTIIDGLDLSPGMLDVARRRGIYRYLVAADLLQPLTLGPDRYDALLSAGTFTAGHVDARPLPDLLGVVRPGGHFAFVVGSGFWSRGGFETMLSGLTAATAAEVLHCAEEPIAADGLDRGFFVVLRRPAALR